VDGQKKTPGKTKSVQQKGRGATALAVCNLGGGHNAEHKVKIADAGGHRFWDKNLGTTPRSIKNEREVFRVARGTASDQARYNH